MSNPRASLLAGLRTGGPRSVSNPMGSYPQTAGPTAQFDHRRISMHAGQFAALEQQFYPQQKQHQQPRAFASGGDAPPMTAPHMGDVDVAFLQQQQQQQQLMLLAQQMQASAAGHPHGVPQTPQAHQLPFSPSGIGMDAHSQLSMQLELLKLQQQQQQQQLYAMSMQQQMQRQAQTARGEPMTAGPGVTAFNVPSVQSNASRHPSMTAALDGRFNVPAMQPFHFGESELASPPTTAPAVSQAKASNNWRRSTSGPAPVPVPVPAPSLNASVNAKAHADTANPSGVISGGTLLGNPNTPRHGSVSSWRRASVGGARQTSLGDSVSRHSTSPSPPPTVYVSSPEEELSLELGTKPLGGARIHRRPQPLHFGAPNAVAEETDEPESIDLALPSTASSDSTSADSPVTPTREEAARHLRETLGLGRPPVVVVKQQDAPVLNRQLNDVIRQPLGPPGSVEELGSKNFASRIRRQAIGGLNVLRQSRERRASMNLTDIAVAAY